MKIGKLDHYFPTTSVRSLKKSNFELVGGKVFSEEDKLLQAKVAEFKSADEKTRLTNENYHSMMKLMLQLEDECESAKCLSFDQEGQPVVHVRERVYSLKIVSVKRDARRRCFAEMRTHFLRGRIHIRRTIKNWTRQPQSTHVYGSHRCQCARKV